MKKITFLDKKAGDKVTAENINEIKLSVNTNADDLTTAQATADSAASGLTSKADKTTTITINGTTQDLSTNRSWTIAGDGGGDTVTDSTINGNIVVNGAETTVYDDTQVVKEGDSRLTDDRTPTAHNHDGVYEPAFTTLSDGKLSENVTKAGNTFNGANQLVKTDATGKLPAVDGSQLSNLPLKGSIKAGYHSSKLSSWFKKVYDTPSTTKVVFVGDSTSDLEGNASGVPGIINKETHKSGKLESLNTTFRNFGSSGAGIDVFLTDETAAGKGIGGVIDHAPDLVVFSYGINDVRTNNLTKNQLKAKIIEAVDLIQSRLPNADIILRMPNSFRIPTDQTYIQQGSYSSLAEAAQAQSDILYWSYKELEYYWENVVLVDTQTLIFGRTVKATSNLMTDEIHPKYDGIINEIIKIIGYKRPYAAERAKYAMMDNYATPYSVYNRALENREYYIPILVDGTLNGRAVNSYFDINCDSFKTIPEIRQGDIITIGDELFIKITVSNIPSVLDAGRLRVLWNATPDLSGYPVNTPVKIYKSIFNHTKEIERYYNDRKGFPYRRKARLAGGNGYLDLSGSLDDQLTFQTPHLTPSQWNVQVGDIICAEGMAPYTIPSGASIGVNNSAKRILITGDFSVYKDKVAYIFGNHAYENPYA